MADTPNPGSEEAIAQGCTCPVIDNHHGKGIPSKEGQLFWYNGDCPVHVLPRDRVNSKALDELIGADHG